MLQIAIVIKQSTLRALTEHSAGEVGGALPLNQAEVLVLLDAQVVRRLLDEARPGDTRIDDVIKRLAL